MKVLINIQKKFKVIMMTIPENKGQHKSGEEEVTKQKKDNQHYHKLSGFH